ncbi:hypothetical protein ACSZM7_05015 [Aeromonas veronii]
MRTLSGWRSLPTHASTHSAQARPRLACPLYVSISMHVNDWWRLSAPRASTGRA